jgi:hypothetical protein
MDMEIDLAIELINEAASNDLERAQEAVRASDPQAAMAAIGEAISRLGAALDSLRDVPRSRQELGLQAIP